MNKNELKKQLEELKKRIPYEIGIHENKKVYEQILTDLLNDTKAEVILDDRDASLGFKMKDFELIGIPYIIIVGRRANEGIVELKTRATNEKVELPYEEAIKVVVEAVKNI